MSTETSTVTPNPATKQNGREAFLQVYDMLRNQLLEDKLISEIPSSGKDWFKKALDYNVPGGKLNRGMAVLDVYQAIKGDEYQNGHPNGALSPETKCNIVGWCIEFLQAFFLVADDIMDGSWTRRGQDCWFRVPGVGMIACNDYILLETSLYRVLSMNFKNEKYYAKLLDLFHDVTHQTAQGQMLDLITAPTDNVDLSRFTMNTYMQIVTYKTAYYSFYLPVAAGMILAEIENEAAYQLAQDILVKMGQFFQVQDDVLDCFGEPEKIGKIGTDIEDNKCSWLVCKAMLIASDSQKEIIEQNYGQKDADKVAKVKEVYRELELQKIYEEYEESSYQELSKEIEEQELLPKAVFTSLLNKIYKRQK
eukprot:TRINITY_DN126_c0_g1_i2.p1 TRINITY_DN126_c0_g1~~TRINITY_DN126_c0_g1_i2.p1  ORF type:complete len:398 (-),score=48.34 TRINITY_DN126_c0_g1_i2:195-1286(-)